MNLAEISERLNSKRKEWMTLFEASQGDKPPEHIEETLETLNREMKDLGEQEQKGRALVAIAEENRKQLALYQTPARGPGFADGGDPADSGLVAVKSLGAQVSAELKGRGWRGGSEITVYLPDTYLKTTVSTAAGFAPANNRGPVIVDTAQRRPVIADLIPQDNIGPQNAVKYMEETTFTNNAAARSEGSPAGEAALAWTQRTQTVEIISVMLPFTDQQLEDVPFFESLMNRRLALMIDLAEEVELYGGNGTSPHLQGLSTKSGIQTQPKGADPTPSAIYKAMTLIRFTGFAEPSGLVIHPNDWQDIMLLQDTIGNYIFGSPAQPKPNVLWGLPVIVTTAATENTALLADFVMYTHISRRQGVTVAITNSYGTEFGAGVQRVRLDTRESLEIYRAAAICTVTGV